MPPDSPVVIWILSAVVALLAGLSLVLMRVVLKRIQTRPEEVLAASSAAMARLEEDAKAVRGSTDKVNELVRDLASDLRVLKTQVRDLTRRQTAQENGLVAVTEAVNENRADIGEVQGSLGMLQENAGFTPSSRVKAKRRKAVRYPTPVEAPPGHEDCDEGEGA